MRRIARSLGVVGVALALTSCWAVPGQNANRTAHNAFETELTPATVGELTQAWASDPFFPLATSDPVVSSAGVHAVVGGCAAFTFDPADGEWLWLNSGVSPFCEDGDTAFMQFIRGYSPPFVVDGRLLWSHWGAWDRNAPRPPDYLLLGGVAHYDLASDQLLSANGGPGMLLAAVRGDTAVARTYRIVWSTPQPPFAVRSRPSSRRPSSAR